MKSFQNKIAVITGAGSGIGRALALQLAEAGAHLALNDWNGDALQETANMISSPCTTQAFDVSDRVAMDAFAAQTKKELGEANIIINNAGLTLNRKLLEDASYEDFEKVLNVNLWGTLNGTYAFLDQLQNQSEAALVNISSVFGIIGYPTQGPYCVSKFAVRGFTETLRIELKTSHIQVHCVHPGGIQTNIVHNIKTEDQTNKARFEKTFSRQAITSPETAAAVIINGIKKNKPRILIGKDARSIARFARLWPSSYEKRLLGRFNPEKFRTK